MTIWKETRREILRWCKKDLLIALHYAIGERERGHNVYNISLLPPQQATIYVSSYFYICVRIQELQDLKSQLTTLSSKSLTKEQVPRLAHAYTCIIYA